MSDLLESGLGQNFEIDRSTQSLYPLLPDSRSRHLQQLLKMDASPKAGPSVHRKRTKSRSSLAPPVIEPAATATAAESNGMDVDSAPTANAEASSSKLPTEEKEKKKKSHSSTSKERRRRKNAAKEAAGLFADRPEPHTVEAKKAGDATIKGGEAEIGKKSKSQRRKGRGKGEGAIWECHSLAQGNVSRIPPVWSADGRYVFQPAPCPDASLA